MFKKSNIQTAIIKSSKEGGKTMYEYESDKVVGASHREAIQWITAMDLWDEVIDLEVDCYGIVTAVIH